MRYIVLALCFTFFILTFSLTSYSIEPGSENFEMSLGTVDSGGGKSVSENFNLNSSTGQSTAIGKSESENYIDHAGFQQPDNPPYSITGRVFNDLNCNGQRNVGEDGISGVKVTLNPGAIVVYTASDGKYNFPNLAPGTYTVKETDPTGYVSCTQNKITVMLKNKNVTNQDFGDQAGQ